MTDLLRQSPVMVNSNNTQQCRQLFTDSPDKRIKKQRTLTRQRWRVSQTARIEILTAHFSDNRIHSISLCLFVCRSFWYHITMRQVFFVHFWMRTNLVTALWMIWRSDTIKCSSQFSLTMCQLVLKRVCSFELEESRLNVSAHDLHKGLANDAWFS